MDNYTISYESTHTKNQISIVFYNVLWNRAKWVHIITLKRTKSAFPIIHLPGDHLRNQSLPKSNTYQYITMSRGSVGIIGCMYCHTNSWPSTRFSPLRSLTEPILWFLKIIWGHRCSLIGRNEIAWRRTFQHCAYFYSLTHLCLVTSSVPINWKCTFMNLGVSD